MNMKRCLLLCLFGIMTLIHASPTAYVDGKTVYGGFVYGRDNTTSIPLKTTFRLVDTGKALQIFLVARTPAAKMLAQLPPGKLDTWPSCDSFEVFLDPSGIGQGGYVQLAVGADGSMWDIRRKGADRGCPFSWSRRISHDDHGWQVELSIPYASLGSKAPVLGDCWRFNICRNIITKDNSYNATWAHVGARFHTPSKFSLMYFGDEKAVLAARQATTSAAVVTLEKELRQKGFLEHFSHKLSALKRGAPASGIQEIRDELYVMERIR